MKLEELEVLITANSSQMKAEFDKVSTQINKLNKNVGGASSMMGGKFVAAMTAANVAATAITKSIGFFVNQLRKIPTFLKGAINVSNEFEAALTGLATIAGRKLGADALPAVNQAANDLAADGLMSVSESATGLKNLLSSGFNLEEAINLMNTFKDSAAFGRQSSLSFGKAITSATEGVKNGNSILVDNAGITKNLSLILQDAGYAQQDMMRVQTDASVRQALYNGLIQEGNIFMGDAIKLAQTSAGEEAKMAVTFKNMLNTIGTAIKPIYKVLQVATSTFFNGINGSIIGAQQKIQNAVAKIAGYLIGLIRIIGRLLSFLPFVGGAFKRLANLTVSFGSSSQQAGDNVDSLNDSLAGTGSNAGGAAKGVSKLKKELLGLAGFDEMNVLKQQEDTPNSGGSGGGGLGGGIGDIGAGGFGGDIEAPLSNMEDKINGFTERIEAKWQSFKDKFMEFFQPVLDMYDKYMKPILDLWWDMIENQLVPAYMDLFNSIKSIVTSSGFKEFLKILGTIIGIVIVGAITAVIFIITKWYEFLKLLLDTAMMVFNKIIDVIANVIVWFWNLKDDSNSVWDAIWNIIKQVANRIWSEIKWLGNIILAIFRGIWNGISSVFSWIWNKISSVLGWIWDKVTSVGSVFSNVFNGMRGVATRVFSSIWGFVVKIIDRIKDRVSGLKSFFGTFGSTLKGVVKAPINAIISSINSFIRGVNNVKIPDWVPEVGGRGFYMPQIPKLARGGIIGSRTIAEIGEAGAEAVVPLENNTEGLEILADKIMSNMQGGRDQKVVVKIGDEVIFDRVVDYINDRSKRSNKPILNI